MPTIVTPTGFLSSRNYPGFWAAFFLVVLRIAIGWHFLTEGLEKYQDTAHGKKPFSAEIYLRNATGPFAPKFRSLLPDVDSKEILDQEKLKLTWSQTVAAIENHYNMTEEQKAKAKELLEQSYDWSNVWFNAYDNKEARDKYLHNLSKVEEVEQNPNAMSFEKERAWETRAELEGDRRKLIAPLIERGQQLADSVSALALTPEQVAMGPYTPPSTSLDLANKMTMYGLIAIGVCLILGFLTPLAALCAAVFLGMIYLSMPPLHGLPPNPKAEGHYWIVNKNLIELIACLLIAVTASGHWFGFDALLFGASRRRRWARYEARQAERYGLQANH